MSTLLTPGLYDGSSESIDLYLEVLDNDRELNFGKSDMASHFTPYLGIFNIKTIPGT